MLILELCDFGVIHVVLGLCHGLKAYTTQPCAPRSMSGSFTKGWRSLKRIIPLTEGSA